MVPYTIAVMTEKMKTIGEKRRIFVGRIIESMKSSLGVLVDFKADWRDGFPVDLRSFLARCSRMDGGYVSLWRIRLMTNTAPV
jgi:hypothetical protein